MLRIFVPHKHPMTIDKLLNYLRLGDNAEDPKVAMEAIARGVVFRGTNLLILVFAILIASVGLNVNSAAVVIGAMLISPLMGPIMGVGAGVGVMDFRLVRRSVYNLGFAVGASIATSTLYFLITPLSEAHSEILARTSPTIWDVLIALSGGFAGVIAAASKERGNVVPGVAIATALMPPLCTAGYGLAHLNWSYFLGAFYLFLINSVFIGIATLFTVRWMGYPMKSLADERVTRKVKRYTAIIIFITVVPSVFLAYRLVLQTAFENRAEQYVLFETDVEDNFLVKQEIDAKARTILLTYVGNGLTPEEEDRLRRRLGGYDIADAELTIRTGLSIRDLDNERMSMREGEQRQQEQNQALMAKLASLNDSLVQRDRAAVQLMTEARAVIPGLRWVVLADIPGGVLGKDTMAVVASARFATMPDTAVAGRLDRWLSVRLKDRRHLLCITADPQKK